MDRLRAMDTFVHVVKAGSLSAAARQLGMSRAMVSRQLQQLEDHLQVRLLNRTTRTLRLTDAGTAYLELATEILDRLEERERQLLEIRKLPKGRLKIVAPKSFGSLVLSDAVLAFSERYPEIQATLILDDFSFRAYDFVDSGLDVAIRLAPMSDAAVITRKLTTLRWVLCAAPAYIARKGMPETPHDLAGHDCLTHINLDLNDRTWLLDGPGGATTVRVTGRFLSNSALVLRKAALAGLGIGLIPGYCIQEDLDAGRLIPVLGNYQPPSRELLAIFPHRDLVPRSVRLFVDFMVHWFDPSRSD